MNRQIVLSIRALSYASPTDPTTSKMTIAEYLTYWLTNVAKGKVRRTTYVNYESLVRNYVTSKFGKKKLVRLTARDIRAFLTKTAAICQCEVLCARADVRKIRFHDLPHTCASLLHEQGADARMIMEVLGHSSILMTMDIYTFVRLDSQRSAFDRVGDALRGDDNDSDDDDGAAGVPVAI
ncbi:tyrosine-type recombinase/integrase [Streptomyces massasporeus]|uniref:tyrosine-type recombinase/integrase n=1 Tax=Streptomyces massasporeus TaxID=67324 RepID=UPI00382FAC15